MTDAPALVDRLRKLAVREMGLTVTLLAGAVLTLRIMAVARFDTSTALAMLQTGGTGNVLVGAAVAVLPVVPLYFGTPFGVLARQRQREHGTWSAIAWAATPVVLASAVLPPAYLLGFVGLTALGFSFADSLDVSALLASLAVATSFVVIGAQPWWPVEAVTIMGEKPQMAYVVGRDGDELVLLTGAHHIRRVPSASVVERGLCTRSTGVLFRNPTVVFWRASAYPTCP